MPKKTAKKSLNLKDLEKLKDGKKATSKANVTKVKNAAKKAANEFILGEAAKLPFGQGNKFLALNQAWDKLDDETAATNLKKREVISQLKEMKVEITPLREVRKYRKMEPADVLSHKATVALYEQQLSMPLSEGQKKIIDDLNQKREEMRETILASAGTDTGKEVGSAAGSPMTKDEEPVAMSSVPVPEVPNDNTPPTPVMPAKNTQFTSSQAPVPPASFTSQPAHRTVN